jgi:hypothetical protein
MWWSLNQSITVASLKSAITVKKPYGKGAWVWRKRIYYVGVQTHIHISTEEDDNIYINRKNPTATTQVADLF